MKQTCIRCDHPLKKGVYGYLFCPRPDCELYCKPVDEQGIVLSNKECREHAQKFLKKERKW